MRRWLRAWAAITSTHLFLSGCVIVAIFSDYDLLRPLAWILIGAPIYFSLHLRWLSPLDMVLLVILNSCVYGLIFATPYIVLQRRPPEVWHCPTCGYDLRGSTGACPECGAAASDISV